MKKTIYTLNINDYAPEIRELTRPLLEAYAVKIGADVCEITERKFPDWPVVYEKLQIHELAKKSKADWNIYIDSDALIHPNMIDITNHLSKDIVCHNGSDMASIRWRYDNPFRRDGRHIGSCNWFTVASDWCVDLWHPLDDLTFEEALDNIFPILKEVQSRNCEREHLIDDYVVSRNIARYGLKFTTVIDIITNLKLKPLWLWHTYNQNIKLKADAIKGMLDLWGIPRTSPKTYKDLPSPVQAWLSSSKELPYPEFTDIKGWMSLDELKWLNTQAKTHVNIVEVGSWFGRSTHALLSSCQGIVRAVDTFKGSPSELNTTHAFATTGDVYSKFMQNVGHFPNLKVIKSESRDAAATFEDEVLDMVFIDGEHTKDAVFSDLVDWYPKLKLGGLFCGHDSTQDGVPLALSQFFGFTPKTSIDSIWEVVRTRELDFKCLLEKLCQRR